MIVCATLDIALGIGNDEMMPLTDLCNVVHLIPTLAVTVRRLHDTARSGWWLLISLVPLVGQVVLFVFMCQGSAAGASRLGSPSTRRPGEAAQRPALADFGAPPRTTMDRIEQLAGLRASGTIDEAEFQRLKAEVMQPGAN